MKHLQRIRGFTFVEILVVLAVITIITAISTSAFKNVYHVAGERTAVIAISDALKEARSNTLSAQDDTVYGVRVGTSTVTRFVGNVYNPAATSNAVYEFEAGAYATGPLVTGGVDIVFARLTGQPSATGFILVHDVDTLSTATITIEATGLIQ